MCYSLRPGVLTSVTITLGGHSMPQRRPDTNVLNISFIPRISPIIIAGICSPLFEYRQTVVKPSLLTPYLKEQHLYYISIGNT